VAADLQLRSLRVLAGIRRRRGRLLEKELAQQRTELERCLAQSQAAREQRDECIAQQQQALDQRSQLLDQSFTPAHVRAADTEIETQLGRKAEADKAVKRCQSVDQRQQQQVMLAQAAWRRNRERIDSFDARIAAALKARQAEEDEAADEEAEEMAAARIGGRRRASKGDAEHV
jgi:Bacterial type III secretion protein (HrpB7)